MAAEITSPTAGPSGQGSDREVPSDPRQRQAALADCRDYLVGRLSELVADALDRIAEEMTEQASNVLNRGDQQALMSAVSVVRTSRDVLQRNFRRSFEATFDRRLRGEADPEGRPAEGLGELSLIDDSVLTGKLTVDRLVHRTRNRLDSDQVLGMRARLAALIGKEWFDESDHPAAPEAVYAALKQTVGELSDEPEVQSKLLDAFEPHLTPKLNQVYVQANQRLVGHHVLPRIRRQVVRSREGESRGPGRPGEQPAGAPADDGGSAYASPVGGGPMGVGQGPGAGPIGPAGDWGGMPLPPGMAQPAGMHPAMMPGGPQGMPGDGAMMLPAGMYPASMMTGLPAGDFPGGHPGQALGTHPGAHPAAHPGGYPALHPGAYPAIHPGAYPANAGGGFPAFNGAGVPDHGGSPGHPGVPPTSGEPGTWAGTADAGMGVQGGEYVALLSESLAQLDLGVPTARESVVRLLVDTERFSGTGLPVVQAPMLHSLSQLQSMMFHDGPQDIVPAVIQERLADETREQGSSLDKLTIEVVSIVFDYLYADKRLAEHVKHQLMRLQVVAVKAALIDRSFFARRSHPMRQLIDRMTELASDPDFDFTEGGPLMDGITGIIDWILTSFDQDLSVFEEAMTRLEVLATEAQSTRSEEIAEVTEEADRSDLIAQEKSKAHSELLYRCEESTPMFVKVFLLDWWAGVQAEISLSKDPEQLKTKDALEIAEGLIWSVAPKVSDEIPRLTTNLPRILKGLNQGLRLIEFPEVERQAFFDQLMGVHMEAISASRTGTSKRTAVFNATAKVRMRQNGAIQFQPERGADGQPVPLPAAPEAPEAEQARATLAEVRRGDRIEIQEGGESLRFKLAWISPSEKLYVLSRHPGDARSMDAVSLAELLTSGRARVVSRSSGVDGAMQAIVPRDRESLLSHSATDRAALIESAVAA